MNPGRNIHLPRVIVCGIHLSQIKNEISDLTIELILVNVPLIAVTARNIDISINKSNTSEVLHALDGRPIVGIPDELSVIISSRRSTVSLVLWSKRSKRIHVLNNWCTNHVSTGLGKFFVSEMSI